ncbi:MAG: LamG-like jellyroll fold domain-containing protein, partial [Phycisphaeraceae bacterium]|nr:LamG-like jellyroll fold domain-containing protein [Phycisphaeraceae bacterium]
GRIALKNVETILQQLGDGLPVGAITTVSWTTGASAAYNFEPAAVSGQKVEDHAGRKRHAKLFGGSIGQGKIGKGALKLNGKKDFMALPPMPVGSGTTVAVWVRADKTPERYARVFDFGNGPYAGNMILTFYGYYAYPQLMYIPDKARRKSVQSEQEFPANRWVHLTCSFQPDGTGVIYMNGQRIATGSIGKIPSRSPTRMLIGRSNWASDPGFFGQMDDLVLWGRTLKPEEIKQMVAYARKGGGIAEAISRGGILASVESQSDPLKKTWRQYFLTDPDKRKQVGVKLVASLDHAASEAGREDDWHRAVGLYQQALAVAKKTEGAKTEPLSEAIEVARRRKAIFDRIAELKEQISADPTDQQALRKLMGIYLLELNEPARAASLAEKVTDRALKKRLELLAQKPHELAETEAADLAGWFRQMAAKGDDVAKAAMYGRAIAYYKAVAAKHEEETLAKIEALTARDQVIDLLKKLPEEARRKANLSLILSGNVRSFARRVKVLSAGNAPAIRNSGGNRMSIAIDDRVVFAGRGFTEGDPVRRGLNMVVVHRGEVVTKKTFDFFGNRLASEAFVEAVKAIPQGALVVIAVADTVGGGA